MSDDNAFMISDIDDSEGEELYGEYKQDTINVPDQATNSDVFLDFHKLRAKKSDSAIHENEKSIFKGKNKKNSNEEDENPNNDYFSYKSDEDKEEEKQKNEEIFTAKSDMNDEENEKSEEKEEYIDEESYSENDENSEQRFNGYEEEDNYSDEYYQNDGFNIEEDSESNELSEENTDISDSSVSEKENDSEKKNTSNTIYNFNESNFNADDEKVDQNEEKEDAINEFYNEEEQNYDKTESDDSYRIQNKPDDIENNIYESVNFADESNNFTEESTTNFNESNKLSSDENKTKDENVSNKEDSIKNPISEPTQKRNESSHRHRHSHNKKKEKEEEKQKDNNKPKTKSKNNESSSEKVHSNYTIDEITEISINNGDFSLLDQSNIEKVMSKMRQKQRDALQTGDYDLAEKAQLATQSAIRYYNEKQLLKHSSNRACEINVQLEQTRNDINFLEEHWAQVLENAKQKANDDLLQLRNEQDKKVKDFDAEYKKIISDPEQNLPLEYKKYSSKVLALKKKQEIFINTNNFKMAKDLNKEIKKLEEKEKNDNFLRFQKKKTAERNHMIKKQDEIFNVRKENWFTTIEGIKKVAKSEIEHAKRSEKQLENKYIKNNEFSNKLMKQQQQRSSSLQQKKKDKQMQSQSISNSPSEDTKTVTHTQFTIQRNAKKVLAQEFRERAMINRIIYTNKVVPKVKKPDPSPRTKRQYVRSPR